MEGSRPRGRPKTTWTEVVQKDCQARHLNKEDAMDRGRWKKMIRLDDQDGGWVSVLVLAHPGSPGQQGRKTVVVVVCCCHP